MNKNWLGGALIIQKQKLGVKGICVHDIGSFGCLLSGDAVIFGVDGEGAISTISYLCWLLKAVNPQ